MQIIEHHSIAATVVRVLANYSITDLSDRSKPLSELDLGSLDLIEAIFELEQIYDKSLSNIELQSLSTIEDLILAFDDSPKPLNGD